MANKFATNYPIPSSTNVFSVVWKTTRAIKAAGWSYKGSGNFAAKDTSTTAASDLWGGNTDPMTDLYSNISTTANSGSISIASFAGASTLTVASTTGFPSAGVLFIATTANGWQPITYTGTTSTTFTGCTTVNAVGAIVTGNPLCAPVNTTLNSGALALPQATLTVASTTGFNSSGTIYVQSSSGIQAVTYTGITPTTFTGCSGGTGNIVNGNTVSQGATTIGIDNVAGWWLGSGPQTLKIPLSAAPTGTPLRGETITQATTSAEGELLGYVWDSVSSSGWMAVMPRTGSFNTTNVITGSTSTATFTPLSTAYLNVFNRELMIYKPSADTVDGSMYYICADALDGYTQTAASTTIAAGSNGVTLPQATINVASTNTFPPTGSILINTSLGLQLITYTGTTSTTFTGCSGGTGSLSTGNSVTQSGAEGGQLYSTIMTSSGCIGATGPGMGGTNNTFPSSKGWVLLGAINSTANNNTWFGNTSAYLNYAQIAATNCTPVTGTSADGSFYCVVSYTSNTATGWGLQRVDDTEPGDVDPYVFLVHRGTSSSTLTNTTTNNSYGSVQYLFAPNNLRSGTYSYFIGYQSRGNGTLDVPNGYSTSPYSEPFSNSTYAVASGGPNTPLRIINSPATARPIVFDTLPLYSAGLSSITNSARQYKGRLRWLFTTGVGNTYDTFSSKTLLAVSTASGVNSPCFVIGPYDGSTTPIM